MCVKTKFTKFLKKGMLNKYLSDLQNGGVESNAEDVESVLSEELEELYFSDSEDSEMGTTVEPDRIYVHQLNLTSADIARREREKEMVEEEARKVREMKEIKRRQREEEKKRDMEMLLTYNPWGKPGGGNKGDDPKRKKYTDSAESPGTDIDEDERPMESFIRKFGRPGHGAPNRTDSGKLKTQIAGDPAIRFQDTQHVRLSIENQLRYKKEDKENYKKNIDELIQQKHEILAKEREREKQKLLEMRELYPFGKDKDNDPVFMPTRPRKFVLKDEDYDPWGKGFGNPYRDKQGNTQRHKFLPSTEQGIPDPQINADLTLGLRRNRGGDGDPHFTESGHPRTRLRKTMNNYKSMGPHIEDSTEAYHPWGRAGGGAPFQREDGKLFEEKLGWSMTGHPKKRSQDAKNEYRNTLQQEMEDQNRRRQRERLEIHEPGADVATIIRKGVGGRALKDPVTGDLLPNPRKLTDVTQERLDIRRTKSQESLAYHNELTEQAAQRQEMRQRQKLVDRVQSEQHMTTWDSFWGRPGHGAPRDPVHHKKENIERLLETKVAQPYVKHYVTKIMPSKHKNRYDLPTQDFLSIKRDYEFRTPFPATEV